jgi:hypothetical protein
MTEIFERVKKGVEHNLNSFIKKRYVLNGGDYNYVKINYEIDQLDNIFYMLTIYFTPFNLGKESLGVQFYDKFIAKYDETQNILFCN